MADESGEIAKVNLVYETTTSANIRKMTFTDTGKRTIMRVYFKGSDKYFYEYLHVSLETYTKIITAESVGGEFNDLIKAHPNKYPFKRKEVV